MPLTRSQRKRRALATTGAITTADVADTISTHGSSVHTTTIGLEDLPLELLAAISDYVRAYPRLGALMLVSRRLRDGVSLSRQWRIANEVAVVVEDVQERRRILFDREKVIVHASRRGNTRCLRYVQLTREEACSLCLPLVCMHGHLESLRYLMTTFDIKNVAGSEGLFPERLGFTAREGTSFIYTHKWTQHDSRLNPFVLACGSTDGLPLVKYFHEECVVTADEVRRNGCLSLHVACKNGNLPVVQYLHVAFGLTAVDARGEDNDCLRWACANGDLPLVQYLHTAFELTAGDACDHVNYSVRVACMNGHLPVVQYLHTAFGLTRDDVRSMENDALHGACSSGHLSVVKYLHTAFGLTAADAHAVNNYTVRIACQKGHLPVLQYLHTEFALTGNDIRADDNHCLRIACHNGHLPVVQYLHTVIGLTAEDARARANQCLRVACQYGHLAVVQYLMTDFGLSLGDLVKACAELEDVSMLDSVHIPYFTRADIEMS